MLAFFNICLSLFGVVFISYMTYSFIKAQHARKKYEEAKDELAETLEDEYSKMLGKGEDGEIYLAWGFEILELNKKHEMFSYDDAIEKFRKACELLEGNEKESAETALCHTLYLKYFSEDIINEELAKELDRLYEKSPEGDSPILFYFDKANFKSQKGKKEDDAEDLLTALELYAKVENLYPQASEEDKQLIDLKTLKSSEIETLIDLVSNCNQYEYLDELYKKLVQRKEAALSYEVYSQMDFAQYHAARYVAFKEKVDLEKIDEICQEAVGMRSINKNRSEIYGYWANHYRYIAINLKDDTLLEQAKEKYRESLNLDMQNVEAVKYFANIYVKEGLETKREEPFAQAIEILLRSNESFYYLDDEQDTETLVENKVAGLKLLTEAVKIVRYNEQIDKMTSNRRLLDRIGNELIDLFPMHRMGNIIKADGLLFISVMENTFEKNRKTILKNLQKKSDKNSPKTEDYLDTTIHYIYAGYYAQMPEEEEKVYEYMEKYIKSRDDQSRNKILLDEVRKDPLFANFRHSMRFGELFS